MNSNQTNIAIPQMNKTQNTESTKMVKKIPNTSSGKSTLSLVAISIFVVLAGLGTGFALSGVNAGDSVENMEDVAPGANSTAMEAGFEDESLFEEEAPIGILTEGGIEGEGTHYLDRGLGENKNVYLTSTVLDLQSFVGKKVQVWGNTVAAQNAPWLMDVGKLKVVE